MDNYEYIVTGQGSEDPVAGNATSDAEAYQEAILFLSELMQEKCTAQPFPLKISVLARRRGGPAVWRIQTHATPTP